MGLDRYHDKRNRCYFSFVIGYYKGQGHVCPASYSITKTLKIIFLANIFNVEYFRVKLRFLRHKVVLIDLQVCTILKTLQNLVILIP